MNLEERMKMYKESVQVKSKEEKIQETICKSKMPFYGRTRTNAFLPRILWTQLRVIQKDGGFFNLCFW